MSAIFMSLFKATAGLLVNKARDIAAEKLENGDAADEAFRKLLVSKIDDIKSNLHGLAGSYLKSGVEFLKQGIVNLNRVIETALVCTEGKETASDKMVRDSWDEAGGKSVTDGSTQAAWLVTEAIRDIKFTDLNDSAKKLLADAIDRFRSARIKATEAFSNEAISTSDRVLALKIQLMATILERVDRPAHAVDECTMCLENLHAMKAVGKYFKVQLKGGVWALPEKQEREAVVNAVCQVNHVAFCILQVIKGGRGDDIILPNLKVGNETIDVLRDERVVRQLIKLNVAEFCRGVWPLGQEGKGDQKLKQPYRLATNTQGQFIVADESGSHQIKVYSPGGEFQTSICFKFGDVRTPSVHSIATDRNDNVYVLADREDDNMHGSSSRKVRDVYVFNKRGSLKSDRICLTEGFVGTSVTVGRNNQVFVLGGSTAEIAYYVKVYTSDGEIVRTFGQEILKHPNDIAAAEDGRVFVLMAPVSPRVHTFSSEGEHLQSFPLTGGWCLDGSIALGRDATTLVVSLWGRDCTEKDKLSIYSTAGKLVCSIMMPVNEEADHKTAQDVAVAVDGRIAVMTRTPKEAFCKIYIV